MLEIYFPINELFTVTDLLTILLTLNLRELIEIVVSRQKVPVTVIGSYLKLDTLNAHPTDGRPLTCDF